MMLVRDHAIEEFWLERRLQLLSKLDDIVRDDYEGMPDEEVNRLKYDTLQDEFAEVWTPYELDQTLRKLYSPSAYGGPQKTHTKANKAQGKTNKSRKKPK